MSLEVYSSISYDSKDAMEQWIMRHAQRHRAYNVAMLRKGIVPPALPLDGEITKQWLLNHAITHTQLNRFFVPGSTQEFNLRDDFMRSETQFNSWMRRHELLHQRVDQFLNMATH